jgi:hypothetical protein
MPVPQKEHEWLQRLVGEWTYEAEWSMAPGEPTQTSSGRETVRSLGGLWIVGEGHTAGADEESMITLGFDPDKGRFVGTWVSGSTAYLWVYDGELDADGRVLTLNTEGHSMFDHAKMALYRETMELVSDDHRIFTSQAQGDDGEWQRFMTMHYRRTK